MTDDVRDQLAGLTGFGWTTALVGSLPVLVSAGHSTGTRIVDDPVSHLSLGGVLFVASLGLDRVDRSDAESY
jgi:hypothetical protein